MLLFISADFLGPLTAPSGLASSASQLFVIVPYREITQIKKDKNAINSEFSELSNIGVIPNTVRSSLSRRLGFPNFSLSR